MPSGDDVTGLHAFDQLDPISTVSALSPMPPEAPEGREPTGDVSGTRQPPAYGRAGLPSAPGRSVPPPPPSGRPPASLGRSAPPPPAPPPRGGFGGVSVPPLPPSRRASTTPPPPPGGLSAGIEGSGADELDALPQRASYGAEHDEDTKVVPNAFEHDPDYAPTGAHAMPAEGDDEFESLAEGESVEDDDESAGTGLMRPDGAEGAGLRAELSQALRKGEGIDDTALLELSATTVATAIDMDWDEDEVNTKLRDDNGNGGDARGAAGAGMAVVAPTGNPSPFGPPRGTLPGGGFGIGGRPSGTLPPPSGGASDNWEDEDEALTRVRPGLSSLPPVAAVPTTWSGFAPAPAETEVGTRQAMKLPPWLASAPWLWVGIGAALFLLFAFGVRALMRGDAHQATITLVTKPVDAEVLVDGRPLVGQTSPFMSQDELNPDVEHEVIVRKDGYKPQTQRFRINAGEIKPLNTVELVPASAGTGFSLDSNPPGVKVVIDGSDSAQRTPARVIDLKPGLHVVRLEKEGFQPWETQVSLGEGQVIDLPPARLLPATEEGRQAKRESKRDRGDDGDSASSRRSERKERSSSAGSASASRSASIARPMPQTRPLTPPQAAPQGGPAAGGGNMGSLRINSRPWAQVFVDGRFVGNTPLLNAPVPAGKRKIKLVNPDMKMSKSFTLQVQAGRPTTKLVELMN